MKWFAGAIATTSLIFSVPAIALADSVNNTGYFMPPETQMAQADGSGSAVIESHPVGQNSPVIDTNLVDTLPPPSTAQDYNAPQPWYESDWGVAGIGVLATGAAMFFDHGVNQYANTKINNGVKSKTIKADNILETLTAVFPLVTMVQSPIADAQLAHASSIAFTSIVEVTFVTMGLKYVINRDRPDGSSHDSPFKAHPFDAAQSTFSLAAVLPFGGAQTSSFPSGHTSLAFAAITPYAELYHQPLLYVIPVAVGIGRIITPDGHWTSDVIGGGFIGWLTADLTRRWFPNSDYGVMFLGDGKSMEVGFHGQF